MATTADVEIEPFYLQSERYGATGNVASAGIRNQLGRPRLDRLTVLVREALQNSWDARLPERAGVRVLVDLVELNAEQVRLLRETIYAAPAASPEESVLGLIDEALQLPDSDESMPWSWLLISDRGTSGLGGPTRADVISEAGEPRDFVDFLRNIGQPPDKALGGGTYGYGKAILFNTSRVRTILVYTRCKRHGRLESRLISVRLGHGFEVHHGELSGIYTGRHWWGAEQDEDGVVEPATGEVADDLARALGLDRGFEQGECGTTIAILAPDLGGRDEQGALRFIGESALWSFWPLLRARSRDEDVRMTLELRHNDQRVQMPAPEDYSPINTMVRALHNLEAHLEGGAREGDAWIREIWIRSPKKLLGWLSLTRDLSPSPRQRKRFALRDEVAEPVADRCADVALMRAPRIVVRYEHGEPLPSDIVHYGGVFVAHDELDRPFARSEPPTHDDWAYQHLEDARERSFVRVALKRIREGMTAFVAPERDEVAAPAQQLPLGQLSKQLGGLLTGLPGTGAETPAVRRRVRRGKKGGVQLIDEPQEERTVARVSRARVTLDDVSLDERDGLPCMVASFEVRHAPGTTSTPVRATLSVELEEGKVEDDATLASLERPEVLYWLDGDDVVGRGQEHASITSTRPCQLVVRLIDGARMRLRLRVDRSMTVADDEAGQEVSL